MGKTIHLQAADGHSFAAYEAGPDNAARGLVVVQEIFGVTGHMRSVADDFAAQGYKVICPALFDRAEKGGECGVSFPYDKKGLDTGFALRARIPEEATLADIEAAARHLSQAGRPVGIVGYCWGGTVAWWGATRSALFQASVAWYGGGIAACRHESTRCPVQLHFGLLDTYIPPADIEAIRAAHPEAEIFIYPEAGHGFGCAERDFNAQANELARERTLAFFAAHL